MKKSGGDGILARTARTFALPGDVLAGLPCLKIVGREELYLANHRGILDYGSEEVLISAGRMLIRVRGTQLRLGSMTPTDLVLLGQITSVELE